MKYVLAFWLLLTFFDFMTSEKSKERGPYATRAERHYAFTELIGICINQDFS